MKKKTGNQVLILSFNLFLVAFCYYTEIPATYYTSFVFLVCNPANNLQPNANTNR